MLPFLVGLAVLLAGGIADFLAENDGPLHPDKLYAGSLGAAIFLAAGTITESLLARRYGPRARVDLWRATQFAALLLAVATWLQLAPLFDRATYLAGVSSRWEQLEPEHLLVPLGAALAAFVLRRRDVPTALAPRALVALAVALVALVGAELRLRRAPPPWRLLDALPVVVTLSPIDRSRGPSATSHHGELWVRRFWSAQYPTACDVSVARSEEALTASIAPEHMVPVGCGALTLRALPATHEYVLVGPPESYRNAFVLDGETLTRAPVGRARLRDYTDRMAPPRGWVRASWALLCLGSLALIGRRGSKRWRDGYDRWRAATLDAAGTVRFDDGTTVPMPYGASAPPGPVVVLGSAARSASGPFREGPAQLALTADDVRAGTPASVLAELDAARDARWVRLAATAWLAAAPLAPFAARGMLF